MAMVFDYLAEVMKQTLIDEGLKPLVEACPVSKFDTLFICLKFQIYKRI